VIAERVAWSLPVSKKSLKPLSFKALNNNLTAGFAGHISFIIHALNVEDSKGSQLQVLFIIMSPPLMSS